MFTALWRYRHFVVASITGELKSRFVRSRLGLLWSILHPLAQAAIFALVLAEVLGAKLGGLDDKSAYPLYLLGGMAAWTLFSEIVNRCLTVFIDNASTMKKISFPRICLPFIVWGNALLNHFFLLISILIIIFFFGKVPGSAWIALPLGIALISTFAFGLGMILGILNVFSRDVGQVTTVALQLWFWVTPIVYPSSIVPSHLQWLQQLNPIAPLINIYQHALVYNEFPSLVLLLYPAAVSFILFALSFYMFKRASPEIVDVL